MQKTAFILVLILLSIFIETNLYGQIPQKWYFGQYAAVDFTKNTSGPTPFSGSLMSTPAGCAVSQNDLYYSNGEKVWGPKGMLPNGNVNGSMLSTQSAVIIDKMSDTLMLFTTDAAGGSKGLQYHLMADVGGKVDVVSKNNFLKGPVAEKLAVGLACNKWDYWVVAHGWNNNEFYAYYVNRDTTFDETPVISSVGKVHTGRPTDAAGQMKISFNGERLALALPYSGVVQVFDFDNSTGMVSNPITLSNLHYAYGVEFDSDGNVLYVSTLDGNLYQYDVTTLSSQSTPFTLASNINLFGSLQIGADAKIYLSVDNSPYLAAIEKPYVLGAGCDYTPNFVYLDGARCEAGLPLTIPIPTYPGIDGDDICLGDTNFFNLGLAINVDSIKWDFGDTTTTLDTSTLFNPYYIYKEEGNYKVQAKIYVCGDSIYDRMMIEVAVPPVADLGTDTFICRNVGLTLFPGAATDYLWHNGSTNQTMLAQDAGQYFCLLTNKCGSDADTINITQVFDPPPISLPNDTTLCEGDSLVLKSSYTLPFVSVWLDTIFQENITAYNSGYYYLKIVDTNNCENTDGLQIDFDAYPEPDLGNDTCICVGQQITFNGNFPGNYLWNTGSMNPEITVRDSGYYVLEVSNACGSNSDTIFLCVKACNQLIWIPNAFTPNGDGVNDVFRPYSENVANYTLLIFNRWGKKIFETHDPYQGWDGSFEGRQVQEGVYTYKVLFDDYYGFNYKKYGYVVLYR